MDARRMLLFFGWTAAVALLSASGPGLAPAYGQASPYRGLWVGEVQLSAVNEVSIPIDADNVPIAPDPLVPTPTSDRADLRVILHVNGAGQVSLLRDVAILDRSAAGSRSLESDIALVTDPRLYAEFAPQPAMRIASVAFDFGDASAAAAIDVIVEQAATGARDFVGTPGLALGTQGERVQARLDGVALLQPGLETIAANADVAASFAQFLQDFDAAAVDTIAVDPSDPSVAAFTNQAIALRDRSFYGDSRALDMVQAVVAAVEAAAPGEAGAAAHNAAAAFADLDNLYQRFVSGHLFGEMMTAASEAAPAAATVPGATVATIEAVLRATPEALAAIQEALTTKVLAYDDSRAEAAIDTVLQAIAGAAHANAALPEAEILTLCRATGREAHAAEVARYPLPVQTPTLDYNALVASAAYAGVPAKAALAAVDAAISERVANPLYTPFSLYAAAKVAALNALSAEMGQAARAMRTELPLEGTFGPGSGDPRLIMALTQPSDLGPAGLTGRIYLPANHPTNPFRHRRHPDHTTGFNIERNIRFDFDDTDDGALQPSGYGVDLVTGVYREEIFGLHKPLGPAPESDPVGLRTEGHFTLHRISLIDTLNSR